MKFAFSDFVIVAVVLYFSYTLVKDRSRHVTRVTDYQGDYYELTEEVFIVEVVHDARTCIYDGTTESILVVEITYSGMRPIEDDDVEAIGDSILGNLFDVRKSTSDHVSTKSLVNAGANVLW